MTYISKSSDFALYLEDCFMDEYNTFGKCVIVTHS